MALQGVWPTVQQNVAVLATPFFTEHWSRYGKIYPMQEPINKAIKNFTKRLRACVDTGEGHFEHTL